MFFVGGLIFSTWAARIPAIQENLHMSNSLLGTVLLGLTVGAMFSMPFAGWLIARSGSSRLTTIAALIQCGMLPLLTLAPTPWLLAVVLLITGMSNGMLNVAVNDQAVAVERLYGRPIMSSFHALFSLGGMFGAAVGSLMASRQVAPLTHFGGVAVLVTLLTLAALRTLITSGPESTGKTSLFVVPTRALLGLAVIAFCVLLGEGAMADWSAVYLAQTLPGNPQLPPLGYAAFSLAMALGRFNGDWLTARFGPLVILRVSGIMAASGLLMALAVNQPAFVLAGFAAVGFGFSTVVPLVFSAAGRTKGLPSSTALASVTTLGYFGFLAGPPLIGFGADLFSLRASLGVVVVLSAMIAVLAGSVERGK
jgi:MFS family permease